MLSRALLGCAHSLNTLKDTIDKVQSFITVYKLCSHHKDFLFTYLLPTQAEVVRSVRRFLIRASCSQDGLAGIYTSHHGGVY